MPFRPPFWRKSQSGAGIQTPIAVVAASIVLAIGVGGGSFAAGLITGADIKDGTVASADVKDGSLTTKDLTPRTVSGLAPAVYSTLQPAGTMLTDDFQTIVTLTVPAGNYAVTTSGTVFEDQDAPAMGQCFIKATHRSEVDNNNNNFSMTAIRVGQLHTS